MSSWRSCSSGLREFRWTSCCPAPRSVSWTQAKSSRQATFIEYAINEAITIAAMPGVMICYEATSHNLSSSPATLTSGDMVLVQAYQDDSESPCCHQTLS
eukprot:768724-Hanusia_phi.AAC.1